MNAEFAAFLAAGMESLIKELAPVDSVVAGGTATGDGRRRARTTTPIENRKGSASSPTGDEPLPGPSGSSTLSGGERDFRKTVQEAVGRLKNGDDGLKVCPSCQSE